MNQLQVFNFSGNEIRVINKDGQPWWVAKDVCDSLEMTNSRMAIDRLDEDEKGVSSIYTLGGMQQLQIVNEAGLYTLILSSRKPEAKQFKRWITHEVIPSIRKTGSYSIPTLTPDEAMAIALQQTAKMMKKVPELESKIEQVERKLDEQITLNSGEQRRLQKAIAITVYSLVQDEAVRPELFRQLHRDIKDRWGVASYKDIKHHEFQGVLRYIDAWVPKKAN